MRFNSLDDDKEPEQARLADQACTDHRLPTNKLEDKATSLRPNNEGFQI
jgi:hypothetical protein